MTIWGSGPWREPPLIYQMPPPTGGDDAANFRTAIASGAPVIQLRRGTYLIGTAVSSGVTYQLDQVTIQGAGRYATTIKVADDSSFDAAFTMKLGSTRVQFRSLTFDGNYLGIAAGSTSPYGALFDMTGIGVKTSFFTMEDMRVINTKSTLAVGTIDGPDFRINNCEFASSRGNLLLLQSYAIGGSITNCEFSDWGNLAASSAILGTAGLLDAGPQNVNISNNRFMNINASTAFCIEMLPDPGNYCGGFSVTNNIMDGNSLRGTGVSGYFENSNISNNTLINGGKDAAGWGGWRNGLEIFGTNNTLQGNIIENGGIRVTSNTAGGWSQGEGNIISGNMLRIVDDTSTSISGIIVDNVHGSLIFGNKVVITATGTATIQAAIYYGFGGNGTANRGQIYGNNLSNVGSKLGSAIRILPTTSTDTRVTDNICDNFANGVLYPNDATNTNLSVRNNTVYNNTNVLNPTGIPTGASGFIDVGNIKVTAQNETLKNGMQAFTPAVAGTINPNCRLGLQIHIQMPAGSISIGPPVSPEVGMTITFVVTQDGTGGRGITWNSVFRKAADVLGGANTKGATSYKYDGTDWVQIGGGLTYA